MKNISSIKYLQLKNNQKSFYEIFCNKNAKDPKNDNEIKFDLAF